MGTVRVRLVKKFAEVIDGVDISRRSVGQTFRIREHDARLLIAEQWAVPVEKKSRRSTAAALLVSETAEVQKETSAVAELDNKSSSPPIPHSQL